jgi:uncharacterized repeat protein (TIGR01451 family)
MRITKLQKIKQILRKTSIGVLVFGMLLTSQGIYQASPSSRVYAAYFEPDCAPPNGTGPHIEAIVAAGAQKIGVAGTSYRVKNCGFQTHSITAKRYSGKCDKQTGSCYPQQLADQTLTIPAGGYDYFTVDSPNITCGAAQTDIHPEGLSSAGSYGEVGGECNDEPNPTRAPTPVPTSTPIITPSPTPVRIPDVPAPTATPIITAAPTIAPSPTPVRIPDVPAPTATPTPIPTAVPSPTIAPTPKTTPQFVTPSPIVTATPVVTASPAPAETSLRMCKYEDDNADGIHNNDENVISWTFNYAIDGVITSVNSNWWNIFEQGCAVVTVPANKTITVSEVDKSGWRLTALYADEAKTELSTYTYISNSDSEKTIWFLNTFTPNTNPSPTASPTISPTIVPSASPTSIPSTTPTAIPTAIPSISPSLSPTPTAIPTISPSPTASPSPSPGQITQLKICKYDDANSNTTIDNGENTLEWNFNYTINGQTTTVKRSLWDVVFRQGCLITDVPVGQNISVSEEQKSDWTQTALYADGAKTDIGTYSYTSQPEVIKVLWYLNKQTPGSSPLPTATASPSPTISPSPSPIVNIVNSSYNVSIEKRVDGTRVDGDKVGIQYRIKIKNNSGSNINNFEIRDTLAPDFNYDANTTEGDITVNPDIQDAVTSGDKRRLIWRISSLDAGKEFSFGYRTTGKRTDTNFCNSAEVRKDDKIIATSQACTTISQTGVVVLAANTTRELPATGTNPIAIIGVILIAISTAGWKLSKHIE